MAALCDLAPSCPPSHSQMLSWMLSGVVPAGGPPGMAAVVMATSRAAPSIAAAGGGSIAFVGSISGLRAVPDESLYGMLKAAPHHLIATMGNELALAGVRVNGVAPGWTKTPRLAGMLGPDKWRWPSRLVFYAGVDPLEGRKAIDDLERQAELLGNPPGLKLYPNSWAGSEISGWLMDDPEVAFPVFERAQQLGIRVVAIHKALPLGPVELRHYPVDDIDRAAMAFPDLAFEIVHGGIAFLEETAWQLARFDNVYVNLETTATLATTRPLAFAHALASLIRGPKALRRIVLGDRIHGLASATAPGELRAQLALLRPACRRGTRPADHEGPMSEIRLDPLRAALRRVVDPCSIATGVPIDLLDMGLVKDLRLEGGVARVELLVTSPLCMQIGLITGQIKDVLAGVDGLDSVEVTVDARAEWWPDMMAAPARERLRARRPLR